MLKPHQVRAVQELAAADPRLSLTKIARRTGISRGAVTRVLRGRTGEQQSRRSGEINCSPDPLSPVLADPDLVEPYRCGTCGNKVQYRPCKICPALRRLDRTRTIKIQDRHKPAA